MTKQKNTFAVTQSSYDDADDVLTVCIYLARSCLDPDVEIDFASSLEHFQLDLNFSDRRYSIVDTSDHSSDAEISYAPLILATFATLFERIYTSLSPDSSPADVVIDRFDVHLFLDLPIDA